MSRWEDIKKDGSTHYKGNEIQPIDLYRSAGMLRDWVIGEIVQHAFRNRTHIREEINPFDFEKIKHYCEILLADFWDRRDEEDGIPNP